jgi:formyltetrahydrofolate deformylase
VPTTPASPPLADPDAAADRAAAETWVVRVACGDRPGVAAETAAAVARVGGNIVDADQHSEQGRFYQRLVVAGVAGVDLHAEVRRAAKGFADAAVTVADAQQIAGVVVVAGRSGHCLYDLLGRAATGDLPIRIAGVVSNHPDQRDAAQRFGVPFRHVPSRGSDPDARRQHDAAVADAIHSLCAHPDAVVLARYMRVVGQPFIDTFATDRIINIHHSFLPAFVGADAYQQAWERGVKLIGATAHYVTAELDAGPILAQRVAVASHRDSLADLARRGRELEAATLAEALRAHVDQRVFVAGRRAVVF